MNCRVHLRFVLTVLAAAGCLAAGPCFAQRSDADVVVRKKPAPRHDLVAKAFAIPYGVALNEKQRSEYKRLKADKEAGLREAVAALGAADTPTEKADCSREVNALTREVRNGIRQILLMPYHEALQARQVQALQQGYDPTASNYSSGYSGDYDTTAPSGYGYYDNTPAYGYPAYGYPSYGLPVVYYWHRHHHHHHRDAEAGQGTQYPSGTTTSGTTAKTSGTQVAHRAAAGASSKPSPAKSAPRPATQAPAHSQSGKHHS